MRQRVLGCGLLAVAAGCGQPNWTSGSWATTAVDARLDDSFGGSTYGDAATYGDAGTDAAYADAGTDAPRADGPVDAGPPQDAPPDAICTTCCTTGCCSTSGVCTCPAPDPIAERIDFNVDQLDLVAGGYAFLSVTAQMSDGNFIAMYGGTWTSSDPTVAVVYPSGYVWVQPNADLGETAQISVIVTTADGPYTTSLVLTVKPSSIAQGSSTPAT